MPCDLHVTRCSNWRALTEVAPALAVVLLEVFHGLSVLRQVVLGVLLLLQGQSLRVGVVLSFELTVAPKLGPRLISARFDIR